MLFLDNGRCVDSTGKDEMTPLMYAVSESSVGVVKLLIRKKAKINLKNKRGRSALIITNESNQSHMKKSLIDHGTPDDRSCKIM